VGQAVDRHDLPEELGDRETLERVTGARAGGLRAVGFALLGRQVPGLLGVEVVDDEAVAREEDELGVSVEGAADEKQVGGRGPAVAGRRAESRMSTAAETAAGGR
jgi:hypothetical protein